MMLATGLHDRFSPAAKPTIEAPKDAPLKVQLESIRYEFKAKYTLNPKERIK